MTLLEFIAALVKNSSTNSVNASLALHFKNLMDNNKSKISDYTWFSNEFAKFQSVIMNSLK